MAGIVDNRITMWQLVQEVTALPDQSVADRLNSDDWVTDMQEAVQWLGESAERFQPGFLAVSQAVDTSPATVESLSAAHASIIAKERTSFAVATSDLLGQMVAEKRAWASGDDEHAKTLRLAQHDQLHKRIVPAVQQWCYDALHQSASPVTTALVKVVVIVLSMETGRDFERSMEGRNFSITDDIT